MGLGEGREKRKGREEEQEERTGAEGRIAGSLQVGSRGDPTTSSEVLPPTGSNPTLALLTRPQIPSAPLPAPSAAQCSEARPRRAGERAGLARGEQREAPSRAAPGSHARDSRVLQVPKGSGRCGTARRLRDSSALALTHRSGGRGRGTGR